MIPETPPLTVVQQALKTVAARYQREYDNANKNCLEELIKAHIEDSEGLSPAEFVNKHLPLTAVTTRMRNELIINMWYKVSRANKFVICSLRCQGGKTWIVIKAIKNTRENTLNIVYTMNSLLNTEQFSSRVKDEMSIEQENQIKDLDKNFGEDNVWVFSSVNTGKRTNHVKTLGELAGLCASKSKCPKVIVMCAHPKRLKDGFELIETLHNDISCPHIDTINIYYDELHSYINMSGDSIRNRIINIDKLDKVGEIMGITATPGPIWLDGDDYFGNLWIRPLEERDNDNDYCSSADMTFINHEMDEMGGDREHSVEDKHGEIKMMPYDREISYVIGVLEKYPEILAKGKSAFIPGLARSCETHTQVKKIIMEKSRRCAIVVTLNGTDKSFVYYNDPDDEDEPETRVELGKIKGELSKRISELRNGNGLKDRPLVYTGHICVSMGQTLVNKSLGPLDYEILGHENMGPEDIYQLAGRGLGRMKAWEKSYNTKVYCPTLVMHAIRGAEKCTHELRRQGGRSITHEEFIAPLKTIEGGDIIATRMKVREPKRIRVVDTDRDHRIYDSIDEAIDFGNSLNCGGLSKSNRGEWPDKSPKAPATMRVSPKGTNPLINPTVEYILHRWYGLEAGVDKYVRMMPTDNGKWCVYWKPSKVNSI